MKILSSTLHVYAYSAAVHLVNVLFSVCIIAFFFIFFIFVWVVCTALR